MSYSQFNDVLIHFVPLITKTDILFDFDYSFKKSTSRACLQGVSYEEDITDSRVKSGASCDMQDKRG